MSQDFSQQTFCLNIVLTFLRHALTILWLRRLDVTNGCIEGGPVQASLGLADGPRQAKLSWTKQVLVLGAADLYSVFSPNITMC